MNKSQMDWHIKAVSFWEKANQNLKMFSEACYRVDNKDALAADCKCNVRTVQYYAAAWSLYQELLLEYGETVSYLWERGEISLWRKAPQLRSTLGLSLDKTHEYLEEAIKGDMNREQMAAHVDSKENSTPQWIRKLQSVARLLTSSKNDWKTSLPFDLRTRYDKAEAVFASELNAIVESAKAVEAQAK